MRPKMIVRYFATSLGVLTVVAAAVLIATGHVGDSNNARASAPPVPDLRPPQVMVLGHDPALAKRLIFVGAKDTSMQPGDQGGPMIVDDFGRPVWFRPMPSGQVASDVRVQHYQGRPVLTWWQGNTLGGAGHGHGEDLIADRSYHVVARVRAGHGYFADQHTFLLTPQNTALIEAYHETRRDLRPVGGSRNGLVLDGIVQEIDVATGRVLFEWHSLDHVPLADSYVRAPHDPDVPYDYFHINSVNLSADGNLLISGRHTWTVYEVDRHTGRVIWRLGGKRSAFRLAPRAQFAWQHDPVAAGRDMVRLFDNESDGIPVQPASRVITLRLDRRNGTATLVKSIEHPGGLSAPSQGNAEKLRNGDLFVGWGKLGRFSEFSPGGKLLFDAVFPPGYDTYRAYSFPWVGEPSSPPAVAARRDGRDTTVQAFWNGATNVARWSILVGPDADSLQPAGSVPWDGLDTTTRLATHPAWVEVTAKDATGDTLASSAPVPVG